MSDLAFELRVLRPTKGDVLVCYAAERDHGEILAQLLRDWPAHIRDGIPVLFLTPGDNLEALPAARLREALKLTGTSRR